MARQPKLQIEITGELKGAIERLATDKGATITGVMRQAIVQWGFDRYMDQKQMADAIRMGDIYSEDPVRHKEFKESFEHDMGLFRPFFDAWIEMYPHKAPGDIEVVDEPKKAKKKGGR